jgi:hypothetical protein
MLKSKEHYELMAQFEKEFRYRRLDREKSKEHWAAGNLYENGETNELFKAFRRGYSFGLLVERQNAEKSVGG